MPLKIVRSGILVFLTRTERANVSGRIMNQVVSEHFVLPLETLSTLASWTSLKTAIEGSILRMNVYVRSQKVLDMIRPRICPRLCLCLPESEMVEQNSLGNCTDKLRPEG